MVLKDFFHYGRWMEVNKTLKGKRRETRSGTKVSLILFCFFLSGMAGLIYEVVWTRRLTLIFGTTLYSASTVIAIFMGGLAVGSVIFGRLADRFDRPLLLYALLELAIGFYALLTPWFIDRVGAIQLALPHRSAQGIQGASGTTVLLATAVLLIPTVLMGGTLPVMSKFLIRSRAAVGNRVAQLYALNTLGGALGALIAGYTMIATLGISGTIYRSALINITVGIVAWGIQRRYWVGRSRGADVQPDRAIKHTKGSKSVPRESVKLPAIGATQRIILLFGIGLSGFAALSLEVSWTRVLTMMIGNSVYAFSTILTAYLLGIAFGGFLAGRIVGRDGDTWRKLAIVELLLGGSVIILILIFEQLPLWLVSIHRVSEGAFWVKQWMSLALMLVVMIIPTTLMGITFPLAVRVYARDLERLGQSIGRVYFSNAVGAVIGPLITGFLLIPLVGMQSSILLAGIVYLLIGSALIVVDPGRHALPKWSSALILTAGLTAVFLLPRWDSRLISSGVYVYADNYMEYKDPDTLRAAFTSGEQLFYREGLTATITVVRVSDSLSLQIDGKTDASTGRDADTELILGHLPMLLHPDAERVLIVGLGSGITLGAVEQHPVESIEMVEIEEAVVEAAELFAEENHNALDDPRLDLIIDDARHYVSTTSEQYDVITAEPSNPWISGVSNLFTREQYQVYKQKLSPGGIMVQWAHIYDMSEDDLKTVIGTFQAVFPHTSIWMDTYARDIFMVGTEQPLRIDFERFVKAVNKPQIRDDLGRVYLDDPYRLLSHFMMDEQAVQAFAQGAMQHTDDRPILEFSAPRNLFNLTVSDNLKNMQAHSSSVFPLLYNLADDEAGVFAARESVETFETSRIHVVQAEIYNAQGDVDLAIDEFYKALALDPDNRSLKDHLAEFHEHQARVFASNGEYERVVEELLNILAFFPELSHVHRDLGKAYSNLMQFEDAIYHLEIAVEHNPEDLDVQLGLGVQYGKVGLLDLAEAQFLSIIEVDPGYVFAHNNLSTIYLLSGRTAEAIRELELSLSLDPNQQVVRERLDGLNGPGP
jgi:spermidine synthase